MRLFTISNGKVKPGIKTEQVTWLGKTFSVIKVGIQAWIPFLPQGAQVPAILYFAHVFYAMGEWGAIALDSPDTNQECLVLVENKQLKNAFFYSNLASLIKVKTGDRVSIDGKLYKYSPPYLISE